MNIMNIVNRYCADAWRVIVTCFALIAMPAFAQQITVGPNAHVSRDRPDIEHGEMVICAHLTDPNVLIAASQSTTNGALIFSPDEYTGEHVYRSADGGKSWHYAMDTFNVGFMSPDPSCAFSPDGSAHLGTMMAPESAERRPRDLDFRLLDYRSTDGGRTWEEAVELAGSGGSDRQFMIFDNTGGEYHGRYYYTWLGSFNQRNTQGEETGGTVMALSRSLDGGKHWDLPTTRVAERGIHNGNLVVISDGTVIGVIGHRRDSLPEVPLVTGSRAPFGVVAVLKSTDGGEYLLPETKVADFFITQGSVGRIHYINAIAVDASSAYKDRLYVVWNDDRSGRMQALLSYSSDKGKTWTNPRAVDDAPPFDAEDLSKGPHAQGPWAAVNKDGVVGVTWLDRRDVKNNIGYHVQFSASLDGGETWLPSVRVSEEPMTPRAMWRNDVPYTIFSDEKPDRDTLSFALGWHAWENNGGDCIGMDVDAAGSFHPVWADARTGVMQLWTATVNVQGAVRPERPIVTEPLVPITSSVGLELTPKSYLFDEAAATVSVEARLVNRGSETLREPVIARVVKLSSRVAGEVRVANSDNQQTSVGAAWDFSSLLPNGELAAGARTGAKRLVFRFLDLQPFDPSRMSTTSFVDVSIEILGVQREAAESGAR